MPQWYSSVSLHSSFDLSHFCFLIYHFLSLCCSSLFCALFTTHLSYHSLAVATLILLFLNSFLLSTAWGKEALDLIRKRQLFSRFHKWDLFIYPQNLDLASRLLSLIRRILFCVIYKICSFLHDFRRPLWRLTTYNVFLGDACVERDVIIDTLLLMRMMTNWRVWKCFPKEVIVVCVHTSISLAKLYTVKWVYCNAWISWRANEGNPATQADQCPYFPR